FQDELDARGERDEPVRAGTDRNFLEAFVAEPLYGPLRHDPAGPRRAGVEGHEVGPGLLEPEADTCSVRNLDAGHLLFERLERGAPVSLERKLDVLAGDEIAVVKPDAFA